jgi:membrane-bound serine protease (ClpP class)
MLFRSPFPWLQLSLKVVLPVVGLTSFFLLVVLRAVVKTHRRRPSTGLQGLVGEEGESLEDLGPSGRVFVRGEIWEAESPGGIKKGEHIKVTSVKGLKITVRKQGEGG